LSASFEPSSTSCAPLDPIKYRSCPVVGADVGAWFRSADTERGALRSGSRERSRDGGKHGRPIVPREHGPGPCSTVPSWQGSAWPARDPSRVLLLGAVTFSLSPRTAALMLRPSGNGTSSVERRRPPSGSSFTPPAHCCARRAPGVLPHDVSDSLRHGGACFLSFARFLSGTATTGVFRGTYRHGRLGAGRTDRPCRCREWRAADRGVLWLLLSLYFAGGVFYVRMRIRLMVASARAPRPVGRARRSCLPITCSCSR